MKTQMVDSAGHTILGLAMHAALAALSRSMRKMMYFGAVQCIDNLQQSWCCSAKSTRLRTRFCRLGWAVASP